MYIKSQKNSRKINSNPSKTACKCPCSNKYKHPSCANVPAGTYISKVKNIRFLTNDSGQSAIEISYTIIDAQKPINIAMGFPFDNVEDKTFNIKEIYPEDTQGLYEFTHSMLEALGPHSSSYLDIISVAELVTITYDDESPLGRICERVPFKKTIPYKFNKKYFDVFLEKFDSLD